MSRIIRFKKWEEPIHLGYPINSIGNDGSFFVSMDGETAFIATDVDRNATTDYTTQQKEGNIDVYTFDLAEKYRPQPTVYVTMQFVDATTGDEIAPIISMVDAEGGDTLFYGKHEQTTLCLPTNASYALVTSLEGYQPHYERFAPTEPTWDEQPEVMRVAVYPIPTAPTIEPAPIVLENVLFESNSDVLLPSSDHDLQSLYAFLTSNPTIAIEIQGHTDNVGEEADNMDLSTRRAQSVYQYLIDLGIAPGRLSAKGYGESTPIASNDIEAGRALNRRTAFVIRD